MTTGLVKVVSQNVNGILNPMKRSKILSKMEKEKARIVFFKKHIFLNQTMLNLKKGVQPSLLSLI